VVAAYNVECNICPALLVGEMQAMLWARDAADARHIKDTGREISQVLHTKVGRRPRHDLCQSEHIQITRRIAWRAASCYNLIRQNNMHISAITHLVNVGHAE